MNVKLLADSILSNVGGAENIETLSHCSTRLRMTVKDKSKIKVSDLEKLDGVLKVIPGVQTQIAIGNDVIDVYDEINKKYKFTDTAQQTKQKFQPKDIGRKLVEFMMAIFYPLIPAMAGAGMMKSILVILNMIGVVSSDSTSYIILSNISTAVFYFMPLMVAYTAAEKLKCDKFVAMATSCILILPAMVEMISAGTTLFGFSVKAVSYGNQIFPAILCTLCVWGVEKLAKKVFPKVLHIIFVPLVTFLISVPLGLLVLGPLGANIGNVLAAFLLWFQARFGFLAIAILSAVLPLMVATGMHKSFNPIAINNFTTLGYEPLYTLATLAHNVAECGASLAVGIKSKDVKTKSIAFSGSLSASLGITEPALYGVTLTHKTVLYSVIAASGLSGAFLGLMQVKDWVLGVTPAVFTFTCFAEAGNPKNLIYAAIGTVIALVASFVFVMIFYKEDAVSKKEDSLLASPVNGTIIALEDVNDDTFSSKVLGNGVGIIPQDGKVYAPADGTITLIQDTKHAIGMHLENGAEILIHMGINTVNLAGKYFTNNVKADQHVKKGDLIAEFDINKITEENYDTTICLIVTNSDEYDMNQTKSGIIENGQKFAKISLK